MRTLRVRWCASRASDTVMCLNGNRHPHRLSASGSGSLVFWIQWYPYQATTPGIIRVQFDNSVSGRHLITASGTSSGEFTLKLLPQYILDFLGDGKYVAAYSS